MAENTNDSYKKRRGLDVTKALPDDEIESARILLREGLIEEAKKTLFKVLAHKPKYGSALKLLKQIEDLEMHALFHPNRRAKERPVKFENPDAVLEKLSADLGIDLNEPDEGNAERWTTPEGLDPEDQIDLAVAFFEMSCYADALRELRRIEKRIRIENTFLGEQGVAVVAMIAQCLVNLGEAFEARTKLEPILTEPDLRHEDKLTLYYCMGLCEQALGNSAVALGWYQKVSESDLDFRDVRVRIKLMT